MLIRTEVTGIGDPFILRVGERYYAYATSAPDGFRYFTSADLRHWKEGGYCYRNSPWAENCFWAPEVYFYRGRYYILYTGRWKKNHSLRIGLAAADSPEGEFKDLFEGPLFDPGFAVIDATLFFDDDGKIYLYFVRDCSENVVSDVHISEIYGAELADDLTRFLSEPVKLTSPDTPWETRNDPRWHWNEGPALVKNGGKYHLNFSVNCFDSPDYSVGCAVSDAPLGPFVKYPDNPILKRDADLSGPGHNSFFRDGEGRLYTAFHIHTDVRRPGGDRRMCIAETKFDEAGMLRICL